MRRPNDHCTNSPKEKARRALLFRALGEDSKLRSELRKCGTLSKGTHGYTQFCKEVCCSYCRYRFARRQESVMREMVSGATDDQCSFLTVVGEAVESVEAIGPAIARLRQQLRRVVEKGRAGDPRWNRVTLKGWVEVDAISSDLLEIIGSRRQRQLSRLGVKIGDRPVWIVTIHAVVRHDDLAAVVVREAFRARWPEDERVDLVSFYEHQTTEGAAGNLVRYALKNSCEINVDDHALVWPIDWQVAYFEWLSSWSMSFKRLSISVKSKSTPLSDKYCLHSITGDAQMQADKNRDFIDRVREMFPSPEKFVVVAERPMRVSFDSTGARLGYRAAREWCVWECEGRWAYSAKRSERDEAGASPVLFQFEVGADAERFEAAAAQGAFAPRSSL